LLVEGDHDATVSRAPFGIIGTIAIGVWCSRLSRSKASKSKGNITQSSAIDQPILYRLGTLLRKMQVIVRLALRIAVALYPCVAYVLLPQDRSSFFQGADSAGSNVCVIKIE